MIVQLQSNVLTRRRGVLLPVKLSRFARIYSNGANVGHNAFRKNSDAAMIMIFFKKHTSKKHPSIAMQRVYDELFVKLRILSTQYR